MTPINGKRLSSFREPQRPINHEIRRRKNLTLLDIQQFYALLSQQDKSAHTVNYVHRVLALMLMGITPTHSAVIRSEALY